jgi:hypothetical protein
VGWWVYNHFMKTFSHFVLALLILILTLAACAPAQTIQPTETPPLISAAPAPTEWLYEDLLLLDPIDAPNPDDPDLFAIYYQSTQDNWAHIRLDILGNGFSIHQIVLDISDLADTSEENMPSHLKLNISFKNGVWHAAASKPSEISIIHFPILIDEIPETHSVIISLPEKYLITEQPMKISITNASNDVIDSALIVWENPPPAKAPLLLAFWDVLPANTPSQLLQRWDGAHTGPYGSRHGLKHLLAAVEEYEVPVTLLDLKDPGTLAGLDMIGQIAYIQQLEDKELLVLPETGFTHPTLFTKTEEINKNIANTFGFDLSDFAFGPFFKNNLSDANYFFAELEDPSHILSIEKQQMIPLPYTLWDDNTAEQVIETDRNGLTRNTWNKILNIALSPDENDILILGGSLVSSPWADSAIAHTAFQELTNHPWINVLSRRELLSIKADQSLVEFLCDDLFCSSENAAWTINEDNALDIAFYLPDNAPAASTRVMGTHLLQPTSDTNRQQLQANSWSQLGHLARAAYWTKNLLLYDSSCDTDIDADNVPECSFVSANTTATFEIADASLISTFHLDGNDINQWVGPTSQIVVGMSDPTFWDLDAGTYSDPSVIPGSFILNSAEPLTFEVSELDQDHIRFTSTDSTVSKDYRFIDDRLTVTIETDQPLSTDLVLVLDPQQRFQPGWADMYNIFSQSDDSFCWGAKDGNSVCVSWTGDPEVEINTFKDSLESLSQPLDPNKVYPPGHFLPMSLATVTFSTDKDFTVTLSEYAQP